VLALKAMLMGGANLDSSTGSRSRPDTPKALAEQPTAAAETASSSSRFGPSATGEAAHPVTEGVAGTAGSSSSSRFGPSGTDAAVAGE
jgi:hypothetical protein